MKSLISLIGSLNKRLYKFDNEKLLIDLDPYEMHRRIRFYESKNDILERDKMNLIKKLSLIHSYLSKLNITEHDLK